MMLKKISLIASLLFFLLETNVFAQSYIETASSKDISKKTVQSVSNNEVLSSNAYILPGIVCIVFIIGIGSYWLIYRRKALKKEA